MLHAGILRLAEKYGNERMEQACLRLGTITTSTYTRLKNILEHGLDNVPLQQGDTSQLPIAKWYDYINEPTLADAIMDRLTANARRIELKGQSLRRKSK